MGGGEGDLRTLMWVKRKEVAKSVSQTFYDISAHMPPKTKFKNMYAPYTYNGGSQPWGPACLS